jgi:hypothetical protein
MNAQMHCVCKITNLLLSQRVTIFTIRLQTVEVSNFTKPSLWDHHDSAEQPVKRTSVKAEFTAPSFQRNASNWMEAPLHKSNL